MRKLLLSRFKGTKAMTREHEAITFIASIKNQASLLKAIGPFRFRKKRKKSSQIYK